MTSTTARRDAATDEEFLAQLYKGGELLAAGKVDEAKGHLEQAYGLQPKNEKAQNLLGLTYFKLGQFERASTIYEQLVNENPADPTLRVNLGLVYLKTNDLTRSVREFETATDLEPGHKKAHNYLGLALAQAGDYARAREHFVISGSDLMAEKMARAMVSASAPATVKMSPPPDAAPEKVEVPAPAVTAPPPPSAPRPVSEDVQIEMMSDEEDVPAEADQPPPLPVQPASAVALASQAQSLGGAGGPPLPQAGFEELPEVRSPALHSDWGAQFGMDEVSPPNVIVSDDLQMADEPALTEEPEADLPLVEGDVIDAQVEAPVVMVEQNVLVPVEDQGALSEQPLPEEHEPMVAAPVAQVETDPEQSWAGVAPEDNGGSWEPEPQPAAAPEPLWDTPDDPVEPAQPQYSEQAPAAEQQELDGQAVAPEQQDYSEQAEPQLEQDPEPVAAAEPALPSWVTGDAPAGEWSAPAAVPAEASASGEEWQVDPQAPLASAPTAPEVQPGFQALPVPRLAELGPRLDYGHSPTTGPFHVGPEGLALAVNGELLARLSGLVAVVGGVDGQPEQRRNRGRAIEKSFGEGANQLQRLKGHGTMYLEVGKAIFQAIDLNDDGAYLREERVFAFEEAVAFENGRLSAEGITIDMVHLKGNGAVLLKLDAPLKAIGVPPGSPLKVPLARLVGWYGQVTPRLRVFVGQATVELTGEGYALLAAAS